MTLHATRLGMLGLILALVGGEASPAATTPGELAREILQATGIQGGIVVHLGCGDGKLTAALQTHDRYQVQGLARAAADVARAREYIWSTGKYGPVAVDRLTGSRLPYIDNLVNLIVVEELGDVPISELLRVLVPNGVAYLKEGDAWRKVVKPWPTSIDEWTHYLHDAGGNAVAHDELVGPPRHLQWIGSPRWSRHHDRMASMSALVSAGGRIFYIMDEGSRISIQLPPRWTLIARDAFNGTVLWKKPLGSWHDHLWPLKSGPTQLARRLVAEGDRVYVTLGLREPVTVLDAATGDVVRVIEESRPTEEFVVSGNTLLLVVNQGDYEASDYVPAFNTGDQARVRTDANFHWKRLPRELLAVDKQTGEVRWRHRGLIAPLSVASDASRVYFYDSQKLICLDRQSGQEVWTSAPAGQRDNITLNFGPKLVVHGDVVLFAGGDRQMVALEAATGRQMWTAPHARGGYESPEDLLVSGGLVWSAPLTTGRDSGVWTGRDLMTGEVKREFPPNVDTYWFHHRCYIAKATDRYLIPSRTGIEFVDHTQQDWDIHHWVRGGCLYGVMPCNGLLYAPPHNCACYPEAKLFGMNALAPANQNRKLPAELSDADRLEMGPAFDDVAPATWQADAEDWPTYRRDEARSGFARSEVPAQLAPAWQTQFQGRLSSVVVADGLLFVAEVDRHTLHALDANSGERRWSYITGGRIDSPPTIYKGRVYCGSADGWVYCLRAADGALAWRFRAAPRDERLGAFEQIESVWPVHGTVLVANDVVFFVAGRSSFLDDGMRFYRLHADTGRKISEELMDDRDPRTGEDLQNHIKILQMPVALPDILSTDSVYVYLKSQQFDLEGNRLAIGPHSGDFATQGGVQRGEAQHLFAPMGFLDDTYFHRAYWVYGRSFAGGHSGYYQAARFTPAGRLLVFDEQQVYGFGRKPEYLKWTTTIEHQLFAAPKEPPPQALEAAPEATGNAPAAETATMIRFAKTESLNPRNKPLTVAAWILADRPQGVVLARGGPTAGYALVLQEGKPQFLVRAGGTLATAAAKVEALGQWTHVAGVLSEDKQMRLYVNGKLAATAEAANLIATDPAQGLEIGADDQGAVGTYRSPFGFSGTIDELRIYHAALSEEDLQRVASNVERSPTEDPRLVLACTFEGGLAEDVSGHGNDGTLAGAEPARGKFGRGMQFTFRQARGGNTFVQHTWTKDVPVIVRALVKANDLLFVAGPPDLINEEETFERVMGRDPRVAQELAEQDAALEGQRGGRLLVVSAKDGSPLAQYQLDAVPSWDGMAAARGKLYLSTADGKVLCFAPAP